MAEPVGQVLMGLLGIEPDGYLKELGINRNIPFGSVRYEDFLRFVEVRYFPMPTVIGD